MKRPQNGLLAGLWEFPFSEFIEQSTANHKPAYFFEKLGVSGKYIRDWGQVKHSYTHFNLSLTASYCKCTSNSFSSNFYRQHRWVPWEKVVTFPLHKAMIKNIKVTCSISLYKEKNGLYE